MSKEFEEYISKLDIEQLKIEELEAIEKAQNAKEDALYIETEFTRIKAYIEEQDTENSLSFESNSDYDIFHNHKELAERYNKEYKSYLKDLKAIRVSIKSKTPPKPSIGRKI